MSQRLNSTIVYEGEMTRPLSEKQFKTLVWELRAVSIFFEKPLHIRYGEWEAHVGSGYGGLSPTMFSRGGECIAGCGLCCKRTFRDTWTWYGNEFRRPDGLTPTVAKVDGHEMLFYTHFNDVHGENQCDFLDENNLCSLHVPGLKPLHCVMMPQMWVYPHGGRLWLSRRLPPRNWRWPQCPIVMANVPYDETTRAENILVLKTLAEAIRWDPKAYEVALQALALVTVPPENSWQSLAFPISAGVV